LETNKKIDKNNVRVWYGCLSCIEYYRFEAPEGESYDYVVSRCGEAHRIAIEQEEIIKAKDIQIAELEDKLLAMTEERDRLKTELAGLRKSINTLNETVINQNIKGVIIEIGENGFARQFDDSGIELTEEAEIATDSDGTRDRPVVPGE